MNFKCQLGSPQVPKARGIDEINQEKDKTLRKISINRQKRRNEETK